MRNNLKQRLVAVAANIEKLAEDSLDLKKAIYALTSNLTQYDMKVSARERKRGRENIHRLPLLLKAADEAAEGATDLVSFRKGIEDSFTEGFPPAVKTMKLIDEMLNKKETNAKKADVTVNNNDGLPEYFDAIYKRKVDIKGKGRVGVFDATAPSHIGGRVVKRLFEDYNWTKENHIAAASKYRKQLEEIKGQLEKAENKDAKLSLSNTIHALTDLINAHVVASHLVK